MSDDRIAIGLRPFSGENPYGGACDCCGPVADQALEGDTKAFAGTVGDHRSQRETPADGQSPEEGNSTQEAVPTVDQGGQVKKLKIRMLICNRIGCLFKRRSIIFGIIIWS